MKKIVEICYSNSMKINRQNYEQEAPFYSAKTIIEENGQVIDETAEYGRLRSIIDPLLIAQYQQAKVDMSGVRIRIVDGAQYPSVTSILNCESGFKFDPQYAERGQEIENIVFDFIDTGKWREPAKALTTITYSDIKYKEFFEKFKDRISLKSPQKIEVYNKKYKYSGEIDFVCNVDNSITLCDLKTGQWNWAQLVAYNKCGNPCPQLAIFDLKNCKLETLRPTDEKYQDAWENFLIKRGQFKAIYGI